MADTQDTNSYKSPYYDMLDKRIESKYGLPAGLLTAVRTRGEQSNADQVSSAGARSVYQIIPDTRDRILKRDGVDSYLSPENAADTAGKLLSESLKRNNGNAPLAVAEYHGGTDPTAWGPVTRSYVQRVTGQRIAGGDTPRESTLARLQAKQAADASPSITKVYMAYKAGKMDPEDAAQFEQDVNSGRVILPPGMSVKGTKQGPQAADAGSAQPGTSFPMAPQGVLDAYTDQRMTPAEAREFEQDVDAGRVRVPQGFKIGKPTGAIANAAEGVAEAISGARRETETTRTLPDWGAMPELSDFSKRGLMAAIGTLPLTTGPEEIAQIMKAQYPKIEVRKDEKGNIVMRSELDGKEYAIKPGFTTGDIPRTIGTLAAFTPAGRAESIVGGAASAAATQAAAETANAAAGGNFDTGEVATAAAGGAAVPAASRVIEAVKPAVAQAVDSIKNARAARAGGSGAPLEGEYIPAGTGPQPSGATPLPAPSEPPALPAPAGVAPTPPSAGPLGQVDFVVGKDGIARAVPRQERPATPPPAAEATGAPAGAAAAAPHATAETVPPASGPAEPVAPGMTAPPASSGKSAEELAATARKAVSGMPGSSAAKAELAREVAPSPEILESAKRLGVEEHLQPGHVTTNDAFRTLDGIIKSIPDSQLAREEASKMQKIAERADGIISELGGTHDLSYVDANLKQRMTQIHDDLKAQATALYDRVAQGISGSTPVKTDNVLRAVQDRARELGGAEFLSAGERDLLKSLHPDTNPTYARLDQMRKDMNEAIYGKQNAFATTGSAQLQHYGRQLALDQVQAAHNAGVGDLYTAAQGFARSYKGMQDDLKSIFGKQLDKSIVGPLSAGIKNLAKGDVSGFAKLTSAIPEAIRKDVVASGLTSAFDSTGKRGGLNFTSYANWWEGLQRNTQARNALFANLPAEAVQRLGDLYNVSKGISQSLGERIGTGRLMAAPVKEILEADNLLSHVLNVAKKAGVAEAATSAIGLPGTGMAAAVGAALMKGRTPAMKAADALINSPEFIAAARRGSRTDINRLARSQRFTKFVKAVGGIKNPEQWIAKARKEGKTK